MSNKKPPPTAVLKPVFVRDHQRRLRLVNDFHISPQHIYQDDGYSGARLDRSALDRLRDVVAQGEGERRGSSGSHPAARRRRSPAKAPGGGSQFRLSCSSLLTASRRVTASGLWTSPTRRRIHCHDLFEVRKSES
jgi:hypothetical protein